MAKQIIKEFLLNEKMADELRLTEVDKTVLHLNLIRIKSYKFKKKRTDKLVEEFTYNLDGIWIPGYRDKEIKIVDFYSSFKERMSVILVGHKEEKAYMKGNLQDGLTMVLEFPEMLLNVSEQRKWLEETSKFFQTGSLPKEWSGEVKNKYISKKELAADSWNYAKCFEGWSDRDCCNYVNRKLQDWAKENKTKFYPLKVETVKKYFRQIKNNDNLSYLLSIVYNLY